MTTGAQQGRGFRALRRKKEIVGLAAVCAREGTTAPMRVGSYSSEAKSAGE